MAGDSINEFQVESVFPLSSSETTVTGHVAKGAIRTGETVSLTSASGVPLLAPVLRIGSAETPINVVREGQKTTLVLRIEPPHVVPGSRLTTRADEQSYGATVIVTSDYLKGASRTEIESHGELAQAESLINVRKFEEAKGRLDAYRAALPNSCAANRLLARIYLEAEPPVANAKRALEYAKTAYEAGGHSDAEVQETLASAMGAAGQAEHGLRYLERLFDRAATMDQRSHFKERIESFRRRFNVPDLWEFVDQFGAVVYQSSNVDDIVKALKNGSIPKDADCRKNKIGELTEIRESIARQCPEVAAALQTKPSLNRALDVAIGAGAGLLLGLALDLVLSIPPFLAITAGALTGASAVLFLTQRRAKTA